MEKPSIEKKVPLPVSIKSHTKYPWDEMEVGDSIKMPEGKQRSSLYSVARSWGKRHNVSFAMRRLEDGSSRMWRIG